MRLRAASGGGGEVEGGLGGGDSEVADVDVGRRRRRSGATANWGDGDEVGRGIWGRSCGRGEENRWLSET